MPRPRQPVLSRERIVTAALALIDADGLGAFSTRRLAAALGVQGPSLYHHFANRDAILDAVADSVDRKSTRQNSSHYRESRMPSSA